MQGILFDTQEQVIVAWNAKRLRMQENAPAHIWVAPEKVVLRMPRIPLGEQGTSWMLLPSSSREDIRQEFR